MTHLTPYHGSCVCTVTGRLRVGRARSCRRSRGAGVETCEPPAPNILRSPGEVRAPGCSQTCRARQPHIESVGACCRG